MEKLEKYNLSPQTTRKIKELAEHPSGFKILATVSEGSGNPEMGEVGYLVEQREIFFIPKEEKVVYKLRISKVSKNPDQKELNPIFSKSFYSKESFFSFLDMLDLALLSSSYYWFVEAQEIQL